MSRSFLNTPALQLGLHRVAALAGLLRRKPVLDLFAHCRALAIAQRGQALARGKEGCAARYQRNHAVGGVDGVHGRTVACLGRRARIDFSRL